MLDKYTAFTDFNNDLRTYRNHGVSYTQYMKNIIDELIDCVDITEQLINEVNDKVRKT